MEKEREITGPYMDLYYVDAPPPNRFFPIPASSSSPWTQQNALSFNKIHFRFMRKIQMKY